MKTVYTLSVIGIALLTGCSSLPSCGTPEAVEQTCSHGLLGTLANSGTTYEPARTYPTYRVEPSERTVQPNFGGVGGEQYQLIMVNTPSGWVQKRCKVLNGQAVACF